MKSYIRNWSLLVFSDFMGYGFGFLATILLARRLTPAGYGTYNVILAIAAIATIIANCGMTQVVTREIARRHEITGGVFHAVVPIRILISTLVVVGIVVYFLIFHGVSDNLIIVFTSIVTLAMTAWDLFESIAFGRHVMKYSAIINSAYTSLWFFLLWATPTPYYSIVNILILYSTLNVFKVIAYYLILAKRGFLAATEGAKTPGKKEIVKMSLPFLWLWGIGTFANQIPVIFLAKNSGDEQAGIFSIGARLIIPLMLLTGTATRAIFPNLSKMSVENSQKFQKVISDGMMLIIFFGSVGAAILSMSSSYFVPFVFGEAYRGSVAPFNFLVWYAVIYSVDVLLGTALSSSDRQNTLALLATVDTIVSLPILYYGSLRGANYLAVAKLVVELVLLSYHWIVIKRILGQHFSILSWVYMAIFLMFVGIISLFQGSFSRIEQCIVFLCIVAVSLCIPKSPFRKIPALITSQLRQATS